NFKTRNTDYINLIPEIREQLIEDFCHLSNNKSFFLKHVEDFFKYYYFHYLNQLILQLKDFGAGSIEVKPIVYTMDWETLSEARLASHNLGWKHLNNYSKSLFAHVNTLELLNYITVDGMPVKDYNNINRLIESFDKNEKDRFQQCVNDLISFYTENVSVFHVGKNWEDCQRLLDLDIFYDTIEA